MNAIRFEVALAREYHVGAGHGRGTGVDSELFRDATRPDLKDDPGALSVRYGHGILRQAVHELLVALPALERWRRCRHSGGPGETKYCTDPAESCPVCRIFGTPAAPSRWRFSTLHATAFSIPGDVDGAKPHSDARVIRRAGMDLRFRRPEESRLFSEEAGAPVRFHLDAECDPRTPPEVMLRETAMLVYAARSVRGIGRSRHRGRGECAIDIVSDDERFTLPSAEAIEKAFREGWVEPPDDGVVAPRPVPPEAGVGAGTPSIWVPDSTPRAVAIELMVLLEEPVIAGTLPLSGNVLGTEPFVPGTSLLGALAGLALRRCGSVGGEFLRTFRGGGGSFPELHPEQRLSALNYLPSLPAPLDLYTCPVKPGVGSSGHGLWSHHLGDAADRCPSCDGGGVKLRRLRPYVCQSRESFEFDPPRREETKIAIDHATGMVGDESLYHREVIPSGTLLAGMLRLDARAADYLRPILGWNDDDQWGQPIRLRLGKRHGRGYGSCLMVARPAQDGQTDRTVERVRAAHTAGHVAILLTSRAILRDSWGRSLQHLDPAAFDLPNPPESCAPNVVTWTTVGGYWRHLGMQRTEELALGPGSVLHLRLRDYGEAWGELLSRLENLAGVEAVGARQEEGFGRFVLAPFPYEGMSGGPGGVATWPESPVPIPTSFHPGEEFSPGAERPADLRREYAMRLAGVGSGKSILGPHPDVARWRTVARLLTEYAGLEAGALVERVRDQRGRPKEAIRSAKNTARGDRGYLRLDDKGGKTWRRLEDVVREAARHETKVRRALHTRALADALAALAADADQSPDERGQGGVR